MPTAQPTQKAQLQPISWNEQDVVEELGEPIKVQFNPESLRLAYANQAAGGSERGASSIQFVGQSPTKLTFDLWFDVTAPAPDRPAEGTDDVRTLTTQVIAFIDRRSSTLKDRPVPPGLRFLWGSFLFEGVAESITESLEHFSENGKPLRARLAIAIASQRVRLRQRKPPASPPSKPPARSCVEPTVQQFAARVGRPDEWQSIARRNDIENPRGVAPGTRLH